MKNKKKPKKNNDRLTLIAKYKKKVCELMNQKNKLPQYENDIIKLEKKIEKINNKNNGFGIIDSANSKKLFELNEKLQNLKELVKNIKNDDHINEYFSKTGHIIHKYYELSKNTEITNSFSNRKNHFEKKNNSEGKQKLQVDRKLCDSNKIIGSGRKNSFSGKKKSYSSMKLGDFFKIKNVSNKTELLEKYKKLIHPKEYKPKNTKKKIEIDICKQCNIEMNLIQNEGVIVCTKCGREQNVFIDSDKPSYKDPPPEAGEFTYKRIGRFDEWLTQYQARETTEIPPEVLDGIYGEINKERITNLCNITIEKVRGYLKKLKMNKYYENVPHIIQRLNGLETPKLRPETEEKLRSMFRQIQDIFPIVCPRNRTNFLSYSYLLRKMLELLGEHQHKEYFRLHKSREKICNHDRIWGKICKILNWPYIKTV